MTTNTMGIIIGGILPALFFGIGGVFQKICMKYGIGIGPYLLFIGLGVLVTGLVFFLLNHNNPVHMGASVLAFIIGSTWACAMGLVAIGLSRYNTPLSVLAPLYNMNTLIVVIIALFVFSEWKDVAAGKLMLGTVLIIFGSTLVANS